MLSLFGFIVGAGVGFAVYIYSGYSSDSEMYTYMFFGGLIGSVLAELFHALGVFLVTGAMGALIVLLITQNSDTALVCGIILGIVGAAFEKYVIMIDTALSGGSFAAIGIGLIKLADGEISNTGVIGCIIAVCGLLAQIRMEKSGI